MVNAEHLAQPVGDLAQRGVALDGGDEIRHQVLAALCSLFDGLQRRTNGLAVARAAQRLQPCHLPLVALRVHLQDRDTQRRFVGVRVYTDDDPLLLVDFSLVAIGGVGDLALEEANLDGGQQAAQLLDAAEVVVGFSLNAPRLRLDEVRAAQRVDGVDHA